MRSLPPFQAIVLLVVLVILGFVGSQYIDMGESINPPLSPAQTTGQLHTVEAEIELVFSSPPISYTLTKPSTTGEKNQVLFQSSSPIENPSYDTAHLVSHQLTTYWLDVIWPNDGKEDAHHFVQINISPNHGKNQRFSFFSNSKDMNETFEYHTGEHHHE